MRRFYLITRDLHLYVGLFLSPFVLVFSVSVFYLVHGLAQRPAPNQSASSRTVNDLVVPPGLAGMQGRARVDALRAVLDQAGVSGEIDFVRHLPGEHRLIVPVRLPNRDAIVSLDYEQRTATISTRDHSLSDALVYLHKMPGPHNVDVRGNSPLMRWWRVLADATAYLTLFITVSGIYLWVALKAERRVGLVLVTWLFAFTGLLLNHSRWEFAQFWPNRVQSTTEHTLGSVTTVADIDQARCDAPARDRRRSSVAGDPACERAVHVPGQSTRVGL